MLCCAYMRRNRNTWADMALGWIRISTPVPSIHSLEPSKKLGARRQNPENSRMPWGWSAKRSCRGRDSQLQVVGILKGDAISVRVG